MAAFGQPLVADVAATGSESRRWRADRLVDAGFARSLASREDRLRT